MRTIAIIQARMGSKRLPGKIRMQLGSKPVLAWVVEAAAAVEAIDAVKVAMPGDYDCDENDVLSRYALAAREARADVIVRLTGDCPLLDSEVIAQVIALRRDTEAEYASNVDPPTWPDGLDCECFTLAALEAANREAKEASDREHVTPWMRRNLRCVNLSNPAGDQSHIKLSIDTAEDLERVRAHISKVTGNAETGRADDTAWRTDLFQI